MMEFVSTRGKAKAVGFEDALLNGMPEDGGLYVPAHIPTVSASTLASWANLPFNDLAYEILSQFIDDGVIPAGDLKELIAKSTGTFTHQDIVPVVPLPNHENQYLLELFHGPTLSFKDVAMGFLLNCMDYLLKRRNEKVSIIMATTGDTGPAAAFASCGKQETIDCWVLYPRGFISEEQERQITTLGQPNVHAIAVENCPNGADDLDDVLFDMFDDRDLVKAYNLSSVNSVNWCRVMFQSIHYFYAYFRTVKNVGDPITFSVPAGAFGNLFAGFLAREMGLPVETFICAQNRNSPLHRLHQTGNYERLPLEVTPSNAIDISLPYNYWRFLYFISGQDHAALDGWMREMQKTGRITFDQNMLNGIRRGYETASISDQNTLDTIKHVFETCDGYLLDPHGAVAVTASLDYARRAPKGTKIVSLLTAHPSKFPDVIQKALGSERDLPASALHPSIEAVRNQFQAVCLIDCPKLKAALVHGLDASSTSRATHGGEQA